MCDFKPGDEVTRVFAPGDPTGAPPVGWVGRVTQVHGPTDPDWPNAIAFDLDNWPLPPGLSHNADHWRKVQRRDLTEWLSQPTDVEEPKRAPAKKRERA